MKFEQTDENEYTLAIDLEDLVGMRSATRNGEVRLLMRTHVAEELHDAVRDCLGSYLARRDEASREARARDDRGEDPEEDCGYALGDPKHLTYHDRMSEAADLGRKAERENR